MTQKHLIIGFGDLGLRLAHHLHASGHQVFGLRRTPGLLPDIFPMIQADICTVNRPDIFSGYDTIFMIVSAKQNTYSVYSEGTKNLSSQLKHSRHPPQRVIYVSSTRVYPQNQGEWVDESSPVQASDHPSELLLAAEENIQQIAGHIIVRLSGLYTRETLLSAQNRLCSNAELGVSDKYTNRIHRNDAARFLVHLSTLESAHSLYLCTDHLPILQSDYLNWLATQKQISIFSEARTGQTTGKRCSNQRLRNSGFQLIYPDFKTTYYSEPA
jgi:nucleoside-diphosphate-sugar epimerase